MIELKIVLVLTFVTAIKCGPEVEVKMDFDDALSRCKSFSPRQSLPEFHSFDELRCLPVPPSGPVWLGHRREKGLWIDRSTAIPNAFINSLVNGASKLSLQLRKDIENAEQSCKSDHMCMTVHRDLSDHRILVPRCCSDKNVLQDDLTCRWPSIIKCGSLPDGEFTRIKSFVTGSGGEGSLFWWFFAVFTLLTLSICTLQLIYLNRKKRFADQRESTRSPVEGIEITTLPNEVPVLSQ